jgi:hypothetical protein
MASSPPYHSPAAEAFDEVVVVASRGARVVGAELGAIVVDRGAGSVVSVEATPPQAARISTDRSNHDRVFDLIPDPRTPALVRTSPM